MADARAYLVAAALCGAFATLPGCGGGGGGSGGQPVSATVGGTVQAPDGSEVRLERIDGAGGVVAVLAVMPVSAGAYSFDIGALGERFGSDLTVAIGSGSGRLRAFAAASDVDVDPAAEALVRTVLSRTVSGVPPLNAFTAAELTELRAGAALLSALFVPPGDGDSTVEAIEDAIAADAAMTAFLDAADDAGGTPRGLGDVGELFPLTDGSRWYYSAGGGSGGQPFVNAVAINGQREVDGVLTTVISETNSGNRGQAVDQFVLEDGNGITNYGAEQTGVDIFAPAVVPYTSIPLPLRLGQTTTVVDRGRVALGRDLDGDSRPESAHVRIDFTVAGTEDVEVPVGRHENALRVVSEVTADVRRTSDGITTTYHLSSTEWLVPDIGAVKRVFDEGGSVIGGPQTEVLVGYDVAGNSRGIQPPGTILTAVTASPPGVAWNGTEYLVIACRAVGNAPAALYGALVTPAGTVSAPFRIEGHECDFPLAVASNGGDFMVLVRRTGENYGTFAVRLSADGDVVGPAEGVLVVRDAGDVRLGSDGTNYLAVWNEVSSSSALRGVLLGADATPLGHPIVFQNQNGDYTGFSVSSGVSPFLVAWSFRARGAFETFAARVDAAGTLLGARFAIATGFGMRGAPAIASDGQNYLVTWVNESAFTGSELRHSAVYARRVAPDGTLRDGTASDPGVGLNGDELIKANPSAAFAGRHQLVAWQSQGPSSIGVPSGIFATRISMDGTALDALPGHGLVVADLPGATIVPGGVSLTDPVLASSGDGALLVWVDRFDSGDLQGSVIRDF